VQGVADGAFEIARQTGFPASTLGDWPGDVSVSQGGSLQTINISPNNDWIFVLFFFQCRPDKERPKIQSNYTSLHSPKASVSPVQKALSCSMGSTSGSSASVSANFCE
jgi:hypothetical protein